MGTNYKKKAFRFAELFCGPGGLSLGAIYAGKNVNGPTILPVWANDYDRDTCKTYARNIHPDNPSAVFYGPVEDVDFEQVPSFDALAFGFPCNDFSLVGEQKGFDGKFGPLYTHGIRAIEAHNPEWFIAENVGGLTSANGGRAFVKILEDLENAGFGYRLVPHLYKFEDYGVPQRRHRIVIIGVRKDLDVEFRVPAETHQSRPISVKRALEIPAILPDAPNNEATKQSATVVERLNYIPAGKNAWYHGIPPHLRLNVKGARMSQIYRRLQPGQPSYTVTGSGGGGTHVYHWKEPRALTNRERARIQTFPDHFIFEGSKESVRKQIGMAVPVTGAQVIVEAVLKSFANIPYRSVESNINLSKIKGSKSATKELALELA